MQKTSEVYKKLYHYTTWEGLQGIIENQTLWATNCKFLNDYSEINFFRDKLIHLLYPNVLESIKKSMKQSTKVMQIIKKRGGLLNLVQHDLEVLVDAQYNALGNEIYILSFCGQPENPNIANNGLLSQWRGYGTGGGAALIFDTKKLEEILGLEEMKFEYSVVFIADVIYSDDEQKFKEELSEPLSILKDIAEQFFNYENLKQQKEVDSSKGYFPFVNCISRYKHDGFREENEVRIVLLPTVIDEEIVKRANDDGLTLKYEKERKFRQKNGQRTPYIELFNSTDIKLPIEKIIVGPHKEKEARVKELREKLGKTNIEITCSEIPFVG